jgi:BED zinc finger
MSGRKKNIIWEHFNVREGEKSLRATCKYCAKEMQGLVARLKTHYEKCTKKISDIDKADSNKEENILKIGQGK